MIIFLVAEAEPTGRTEAFFNVLLAGGLVVVAFAFAFYLITKMVHKASGKAVEAYRPLADPLYTDAETGRTLTPAGWYPTPDGLQDRYNDGEQWTQTFRDRVDGGKLGDPAPGTTAAESTLSDSEVSVEPATDVDNTSS